MYDENVRDEEEREEVVCPCGAHWKWEQLERGECPGVPAAWAAKLHADRYGDIRHHEPGLVTTSVVTGCPRAVALSRVRAEPVIVGRAVNKSVGTGVHSWLADVQVPGLVTERCTCKPPLPLSPAEASFYHVPALMPPLKCIGGECHQQDCGRARCTFEAELTHNDQTVRVSGRCDAYYETDAGIVLIDYKVRNPKARRYADSNREKDAVQQLLTMEVARRQGVRVAGAEVWTCYLYEWRKTEFAPLPPDEFDRWLDTRLPDDERTVWQALLELHDASNVRTLVEALAIPPRGKTKYNGRMCTTYCEYERVCFPDKLTI